MVLIFTYSLVLSELLYDTYMFFFFFFKSVLYKLHWFQRLRNQSHFKEDLADSGEA